MMKNLAIILAGGSGSRLKNELPKQFLKLAGKCIIEHTIEKFENHFGIDSIYIITNPLYYDKTMELIKKNSYKKIKKILKGGKTRQESSYIGISAVSDDFENILIHDAVRPFISSDIIDNIIEKLNKYDAIDVAVPSPDTIIRIDENSIIKDIPERKYLRRGQTPQAFKLKLIKKAHELALKEGFSSATDDCSLILKYKLSDIYVVNGSDFNIKITYPIDIHIADKIFQVKNRGILRVEKGKFKEKLRGKVIVVFGGSSGIGKAIVEISKKFGAIPYSFSKRTGTDIRNYDKVKTAFETVRKKEGKIDSVIISSGILDFGFAETMSLEKIEEIVAVNYLGNIYVSKTAVEYLKETSGSLIFFASSSYTRGRTGYSVYSSTKAAIVNFAQAISDEFSKHKIKVNVINPERAATPMRFENFGKEDEKTLLSPEFIAYHTLNIILSDITGQIFDIRVMDEKKG
jgi:2-C-methyl-D-erythritol 4-phosphate cytidylyltransferase